MGAAAGQEVERGVGQILGLARWLIKSDGCAAAFHAEQGRQGWVGVRRRHEEVESGGNESGVT